METSGGLNEGKWGEKKKTENYCKADSSETVIAVDRHEFMAGS